MNRLQGKYALITGASQGLGLQMAIALAREGAAGVAIVARGVELLEEARRLIETPAPETKVLAIAADVSQPQAIERVVATTLNEFQGHLDVLVNNASAIGPSPMPFLLDYPLEDFHNSSVRVNWVDPGNMNTAMHRAAEPEEDPSQWADPKTITDIFVYLASDESKHVHGQRFEAQDEDELENATHVAA